MDSFLQDLKQSFGREFDAGDPSTNREVMFEVRKRQNKTPDATMWDSMSQAYRTPQAIKAVLGLSPDQDFAEVRKERGVDFDVSSPGKKTGTALGALAADIVQDSGRSFWWLLNAPQAVGNVVADQAIKTARPDLYDTKKVELNKPRINAQGKRVIDRSGNSVMETTTRSKFGKGAKALMLVPAGLAVNAGIGLMNPLGGKEGYKAVMPSEEDPAKTDNVLAEVATKYILGRSGNLLPYDEFVKVRPDVSESEYKAYKGYLHNRNVDLNLLDDGRINIPGVLKTNPDGIHGPEANFLGKTLSVTETGIPFATSVAGAALGARYGGGRPVMSGSIGGFAGLAAGQIVGNIIEQERRRRNTAENALDGTLS